MTRLVFMEAQIMIDRIVHDQSKVLELTFRVSLLAEFHENPIPPSVTYGLYCFSLLGLHSYYYYYLLNKDF